MRQTMMYGRDGMMRSLELDDADPAGLLTVAWTKPDVVAVRKADLDGKVWS